MGVSILDPIVCVLLGVLAVPNLLIAKRPDAKKIIDKIAPFQGWIGALAALWGVWRIIFIVIHIGDFMHALTMKFGVMGLIGALAFIIYAVVLFSLGILLGIGVLKRFIKNAQAQASLDQTLAKIQPHQGTLGIVALIDGVVLLLFALHILK